MIEVQHGGLLSTVQDAGAPDWLRLANGMVGNSPHAPVIECFAGRLTFIVLESAVRIACDGDGEIWLQKSDEATHSNPPGQGRRLRPWCSHFIEAGNRVQIRSTGIYRLALIAIHGLDVPNHLGSAATYAKAGLGGLNAGHPLRAGDRLHHAPAAPAPENGLAPWPLQAKGTAQSAPDTVTLRAVRGPQVDAFDDAAYAAFFGEHFQLTQDCDRMGARLKGHSIVHRNPARRDIVSDAIIPGSVQVPGNGQPIIMLADAHTAGGYPKIATVLSIDLVWLGLARPETNVQFVEVDAEEAVTMTRQHEMALLKHLASQTIQEDSWLDETALYQENLIDGVTDGNHETQSER